MLRNRFYIGEIFVKEYRDLSSYWTKGIHEPLIDEETFYKVQEILDGKKRNTPKLTGKKCIHPDLYLRKFLVCPKCGHALTGAGSKGNGGKYYYYFCCHDHKHLNIRAETMNDEFVKYVGTLKPNETVLQLYEQILADIRDEGNKDKKKEIARLKQELAEQEKLVESVEDKYFSNEIDSNIYQKMLKRYNGVIESIKSKVEMLAGTIKTNIEPKLKYSISLINNIDTFISDAPVEVKTKLISSMFPEKIEFDGIRYRTNSYNKVLDLIY